MDFLPAPASIGLKDAVFYAVKCNSSDGVRICFSPNIIRVIKSTVRRWMVHVARLGERRDVYKLLVEKSEGKQQLESPERSWEDNIKVGFREIG